MRADAVSYVARYPNDDVLTTLEQIARTEENDQIRRTAARSLVGYPSPRARTVVRTIIEDNTMSDDLRCDVLNRYTDERGAAEDAAWMRTSYAKVTSPRVKVCMVRAVGNIGGADTQRWLIDLSTSETESSQIRAEAFRRVSTTMSIAELSRQYDNAGNRPMRTQVIQILNQRKEPEALDKLVDILKKTSDFEIRRSVIQMLSQRNDPKAKQAINDIIDK
jgi:HEAT repeat protein